jgi:hypothetical protein
MQRRPFYDPIRNSYQSDPFEREYPHLRIHYLGRRENQYRSQEEWEIRPRHTDDLEVVVREVRRFFDSRRPFMETNRHGAAIGDIAITSTSVDEINLLTSYDPSRQQLTEKILSLLRSGFDHIHVPDLIFRLHLRVGLIARMEGTTEKKNGVQDVDGGTLGECLLRAILIHCLKFEDCRQILSIPKRLIHGSSAKVVCDKLNQPGPSIVHQAFAKLKELIGNRLPIVSAGFFNHIVSLFPSIQIAVWFYNRHYTQSNLPCCGTEHDDPKKTLHLIHYQRTQHVKIITNWSQYLANGRKAVCDGCCKIFPKLATKKQKQISQASFQVARDGYVESHECKGIQSLLSNHNCVGATKCLCCLRTASICAHLSINQPQSEEPLKCPYCGEETWYEQCLRYHLEHYSCKPQYTECACGFKGNEANVKRHECGTKYCSTCKSIRPLTHDCYFPVERKIEYDKQSDEKYYALDIEAVLNPTNETRTIAILEDGVVVDRQVPIALHEINLIVVQEILFKEDDVTKEVYFLLF